MAKKATKPGIGHNKGPKLSEKAKLMAEDKPKATDKQLKDIATLVQEHQGFTAELAALGEATKNTQAKLNEISNDKLPKALQAAHTSKFTDIGTGIEVKLEQHTSVSWPNEEEDPKNNAKALAFLKEQKAEDLLKCLLSAQFGKKEAKLAMQVYKQILKSGKATVQFEQGVHNATLKKWITERLNAGKKVPMAVFNVNQFVRASVKPPKDKTAEA